MNRCLVALASLLLCAACGTDDDEPESRAMPAELSLETADDAHLEGALPGKQVSPPLWRDAALESQFASAEPLRLQQQFAAADPLGVALARAEEFAAASTAAPQPNQLPPLQYHGGPVLFRPIPVYFIWYGTMWNGSPAKSILPHFVNGLSGSSRWRINTTYPDKINRRVSEQMYYAGGWDVGYTLGKRLRDTDIRLLVNQALDSGRFPRDIAATYWVLTAPDVEMITGFCASYCAWHLSYYNSGVPIRYGFVGGAARCRSCRPQERSPHGAPGADAMAFHLLRMLDKTSTDPDDNAWYAGDEATYKTRIGNADFCHWRFGATQTHPNGSRYNILLGGQPYLVAQNWVLTNTATGAGYCAMGI